MLTEGKRTVFLAAWAGCVSAVAVYFLLGSITKTLLIGAFVGGSVTLDFGRRWVLAGAFALAVLAILVALGVPPPDQWMQLLHDARDALVAFRTSR